MHRYVFRQGDAGDSMYVILSGQAVVTKARAPIAALLPPSADDPHGEDNDEEVMQLEDESYFGERAILKKTSSKICRSAGVTELAPP